jgi:hypothetical protein
MGLKSRSAGAIGTGSKKRSAAPFDRLYLIAFIPTFTIYPCLTPVEPFVTYWRPLVTNCPYI